ncbi:MAG TPA: hypothetical protein VFJ61_03390 [Solirubrobacterales bacterium]|nr:hypothetical protein [Solirubrobacterales bacterium]
MDELLSDWLPPWIVVPLILLGVIVLAGFSLPSSDCSGEDTAGSLAEIVLIGLTASSIAAVAGAALYRLVVMGREGGFRTADFVIACVTFLLLGVIAGTLTGGHGGSDSVLVAGLFIGPVAMLALIGAAIGGLRVGSVGVLLPIYLLGAGWIYYVVAAFCIAASEGAFC